MQKANYRRTFLASYIGYVTQAIVNNLAPLLFVVFQGGLGLSLAQLASLVALNFGVQLLVDGASVLFIDKIGYKTAAVCAHILCACGLLSMGILPRALPSAYMGLLIATVVNAAGGGLIEVLISPIVEALPSKHKAAQMGLLHSFYCWGHVLVVVLSTVFFLVAGTGNWMWLCFLWALVPCLNGVLFACSPVLPLLENGGAALPIKKLFTQRVFLLLMAAMVCAGASEQAMSQWASLFAETGLGIGKTVGDLLGPCVFALLMGGARLVLGSGKLRLRLETLLALSSVLCIVSYLVSVFAPLPVLALVGCGLCGLAVGCMWPATISLASRRIPRGGTAMFALFALAGDVGCAAGPGLVGLVSDARANGRLVFLGDVTDSALKAGIFCATVFPLCLLLTVIALKRNRAAKVQAERPAAADAREAG